MFIAEHCSLDNSKLAIGAAIGVGSALGFAYLYKKKLENTPPKKYVSLVIFKFLIMVIKYSIQMATSW